MSRYRKIDLCIHADEKYRRLTPSQPCGQSLWWHLIAGEQTGVIPGLFKIGEAGFAEQLKWPMKGFREAFAEVSMQGMVKADWESRLVWVPNAIKYNSPANPNIIRSWRDSWYELPECALKVEAYETMKRFVEPLGERFAEAFAELLAKPFGEPGTGTGTGTGTGGSHQKQPRKKSGTVSEIVERMAKEKDEHK